MYRSNFQKEEPEIIEDVKEEVIDEPAEEAIDEPVVESEPVKEKAEKARIGRLYNTEKLNVRKAPGGEIAAVIDNKTTVTIVNDADSEWFEISAPVKGFVMKKFIAE